jgi:hypothetical protein
MDSALRASLRLSKIAPGDFVASLSAQGATKPVAPVRRREHTLSVFTKSPPHPNLQKLPQNSLLLPATLTAPQRDQLSLFHVEFPFAHDLPLVKATLAQGFAFGLCLQRWFPEFNDLAHAAQMFSEKSRCSFRMVKSGAAGLLRISQGAYRQNTAVLFPAPN